jgi:small subunit ribosomal protein S1
LVEGVVTRCDSEKNLHLQLGDREGIIPRSETALGLEEGAVREIAVLARVGRPVTARVIALEANNGVLTPILSRRNAQCSALEWLHQQPEGTVLPATVTHLERFGAFVDIGCGLISMIPIDRISVSRIPHPSCRFAVGQEICAVLTGFAPETGHILLSHRELLGTWAENAARFRVGETVTGIVRGIQPYGVFVELTPNLTGLAERVEGLEENQRVSVFLKSIQPQRHKIKLLIIDKLEQNALDDAIVYPPLPCCVANWRYDSDLMRCQ